MSDRTYYVATIFECPDDERAALTAALEDGDYGFECADDAGIQWYIEEHPVGDSEDIIVALMGAAPHATLSVYEEPKYEWLGTIYYYVPGLEPPLVGNPCDADGNVVLSWDHINRLHGDLARGYLREHVDLANERGEAR